MSNQRSYRVAQAVVIVSGDAGGTVDDALLLMQERARANGQTLEEVALDVTQGLIRFGPGGHPTILLTNANRCSYGVRMPQHQYEARCACGNRWRVYRADGDDDDPMATCINCGADTFDLTDIGEVRSAGKGT
jgi:predicted nucleic acid-binding Zn ribbon protein